MSARTATTPAPPPARRRLGHDERRAQIIQATLVCLARDGAHATSLRSVCRDAGVAPSLITHFFTGWHDLLTAAYQSLTSRFMDRLAPLLSMPFATERARMDSVIRCYLKNDPADAIAVAANMAFWQLSRSVVDLRPHYTHYLRARTRLLRQAIGALIAEAGACVDAGQLTQGLILMLDGIWLEATTNPGHVTERRARTLCWYWLDAALQGDAPTGRLARSRKQS